MQHGAWCMQLQYKGRPLLPRRREMIRYTGHAFFAEKLILIKFADTTPVALGRKQRTKGCAERKRRFLMYCRCTSISPPNLLRIIIQPE